MGYTAVFGTPEKGKTLWLLAVVLMLKE